MQVFVAAGRTWTVRAHPRATFGEVRKAVARRAGVGVSDLRRLTFRGRSVDDGTPLWAAGVVPNATLSTGLRVRGGFWDWLKKLIKDIKEAARKLSWWKRVLRKFAEVFAGASWLDPCKMAGGTVNGVVDRVNRAGDELTRMLLRIVEAAKAVVWAIMNNMMGGFDDITKAMKSISDDASDIVQDVKAFFATVMDILRSDFFGIAKAMIIIRINKMLPWASVTEMSIYAITFLVCCHVASVANTCFFCCMAASAVSKRLFFDDELPTHLAGESVGLTVAGTCAILVAVCQPCLF